MARAVNTSPGAISDCPVAVMRAASLLAGSRSSTIRYSSRTADLLPFHVPPRQEGSETPCFCERHNMPELVLAGRMQFAARRPSKSIGSRYSRHDCDRITYFPPSYMTYYLRRDSAPT